MQRQCLHVECTLQHQCLLFARLYTQLTHRRIYYKSLNVIARLDAVVDLGANAKYIWVNDRTHHASANLDSRLCCRKLVFVALSLREDMRECKYSLRLDRRPTYEIIPELTTLSLSRHRSQTRTHITLLTLTEPPLINTASEEHT